MIKTWKSLLTHLKIDEQALTSNDVDVLEQWCTTQVSTEYKDVGLYTERYQGLKKYLTKYFDLVSRMSLDKKVDANGFSTIHYASLEGYDCYVSRILEESKETHALVNRQSPNRITPLHLAALNGHHKSGLILLKHGADVSISSRLGHTPLHYALTVPSFSSDRVKTKKISMYHLLKERMPQLVNQADKSGNTVVHLMAQNDFVDLIIVLKEENPQLLLLRNRFHESALHTALLSGQIAAATLLASVPGLLTLPDRNGEIPLHYASTLGNVGVLKACTVPDSDIDFRDHYGRTAVHFAALSGKLDAVKALVDLKASLILKDHLGRSVLHPACISQNPEVISWLVHHVDIKINDQDKQERTALYQLIVDKQEINSETEELILLFLEKGADLLIPDASGVTARDLLERMKMKSPKIQELLDSSSTLSLS